jgi:large subunit ribosomal protein L4
MSGVEIMEQRIVNIDNKEVGKVALHESIFGQKERHDILHRVVCWQLAKARAGTHVAKTRGEVSGSTRKIHRQKGTGKARQGDIRAPHMRGGGVTFGPKFRSHEYKLNKKVRELGLKIALSLKKKMDNVIIIDELKIKELKTSFLKNKLKGLTSANQRFSLLLVDSQIDESVKLSSANLNGVDVLPVMGINVVDLLKHDQLVITVDALKKIEERLL